MSWQLWAFSYGTVIGITSWGSSTMDWVYNKGLIITMEGIKYIGYVCAENCISMYNWNRFLLDFFFGNDPCLVIKYLNFTPYF